MIRHCDFRTMRHSARYVVFYDGTPFTNPLIIAFSSWQQVKKWLRHEVRLGSTISCSIHGSDGRLCAYIKNREVTLLAP